MSISDTQKTSSRLLSGAVNRRQFMSLIAAGAVAPAFGGAAFAAGKSGGILKVVMPLNPGSLDPLTGGQGTEHAFLFTMFDTLVAWDFQTLTAKPQLATDWTYPDPKTMVINLRQGVTFHDGPPFDAAAVKAHLDRARTDPASAVKGDLTSIDSVEATSQSQVVLHLNQPDSALPLILSDRPGMISSPTALKAAGAGYKRQPVGTGPWKFSNWVDNDVVSVRRNDAYWQGPVALDGIDMKIITDPNTAARSVISGENHFAHRLFPQQKLVADRSGKTQQINFPTLVLYQIAFNLSRPALSDVRVRQAISYAVDRDAFNKVTQLGLGRIASTLLPTGYWAHDDSLDTFYPHDPDKARKLLADAGYAKGLDLQFYGYTDQASQQRTELLMAQLRDVGIRLQVVSGVMADINSRFYAKGEGDLNLTLWTGRADPAQSFQLMYSKEGYTNPGHVAPPQAVQDALREVRASADQATRKVAFAKLERLVLENALSVSLFFTPEIDVLSKQVKGYVPNVLGKPKFNDVSLES
jgi:peptide/nickel transport system permease protein/peptide/nickel transport system substrate-binding protein